jgi:hypothetical protein
MVYRQLLDGGLRSFSIACSTKKLPGRWRGGIAGSSADVASR